MKIRHANAEYTDVLHLILTEPTFTWQRTHFRPADKFAPTVHLVHSQAYNIYALFTQSFRKVRWFRVNGLGTFSLFVFPDSPYKSSSSTLPTQDQKRILGSRVPRGLRKHLNESIRLEDFSKVLN